MAQIRSFAGLKYSRKKNFNFSDLIAPPYDVLDDAGKAALQAKHPNNIVTIDLPHLPAKTVGPDETYARAAITLNSWKASGILDQDVRPAIYAYMQTYILGTRQIHRRGMFVLVKLSPFGQGHVFPHEKTYPEAIVDRLKLTTATRTQLSPIFGLFPDPRNEVTSALFKNLGKADITATLDGVKNDLWTVTDSEIHLAVLDRMSTRPIYIADGHHRYTMALQYQKDATAAAGGTLPANHPANYCMFTLVGMQDDGLIILPTHRLIAGIPTFNLPAFAKALEEVADVTELTIPETEVPHYIDITLTKQAAHTFGLFDGRTRKTYQITFKVPDVLAKYEPGQSAAWRRLDVAILQRYLLDEVIKPRFGGGMEPARGYTADSKAVTRMTDGKKYQIALLLKSTPLPALEELGKTGEVMPPKSTYFFPKLATGMVMNPLE